MPRKVEKTLTFPIAGVARRRSYRVIQRPYAAPWAINMRGVGPLETRDRGGSRPGLSKVHANDFGDVITAIKSVTSIDPDTGTRYQDLVIIADGNLSYLRGTAVLSPTAQLLWPNGDVILWDDDNEVVFDNAVSAVSPIGSTDAYDAVQRGGKLYLADSVLRAYNPISGVVDTVEGSPPEAQPVIALYRDRLFLSGKDHQWYCCRQGDPTDWDLGEREGDQGRALAGQLEQAGVIGADVKAMIPYRDRSLTLACENSLWVLRGDPSTGTMINVSADLGVISTSAWARTPDGTMVFLSNDGVYLWGLGDTDRPVPFSEERVPEELKNVNTSTNDITMAYDPIGRGFHLFITPATGTGTHWWLDLENKAMWPVKLQAAHEPLAIGRVETNGLAEIILGCSDGYLRKFLPSNTTDDGTAINSHLLLGPFRISSGDTVDAVLNEIHGIMADNSGEITWRIMADSSAEVVADAAVAGINAVLASAEPVGVKATGTWKENRNTVERPRVRGAWIVVWLESDARWSYEAVAITANQLGRLR